MTLPQWESWLLKAEMAAILVLLGRLAYHRLYRAYRWFFIYLAFDFLESSAALVDLPETLVIPRYIGFKVLQNVVFALVILEIYRLVLEDREALARVTQRFVAYALVAVFLASTIANLLFPSPVPKGEELLHYALVTEGWVVSSQLFFLCLMGVFLAWFPVQIRRNLFSYILGFDVYFGTRWVILMLALRHPGHRQIQIFNVTWFCIALSCIGFWIWSLRQSHEEEKTMVGHRWSTDPTELDRLRRQLDEINETMKRLNT